MEAYVVHLLGLILLLTGANWFVNGGLDLARRFEMSGLSIGLTVMAFGTSLPETVVSVVASGDSLGHVAIGNVIGSNIANILLVLGIVAVMRPLPIASTAIISHIFISILAILLVGLLANVGSLDRPDQLAISRSDGAVFLLALLLYMVYLGQHPSNAEPQNMQGSSPNTFVSLTVLTAGGLAVFFGAKWVVNGTVGIARHLELSESSIALTVTAIGTSLPELVVSAVAAFRGQTDVAVGNAIGSNIFNLLWVLGISAQTGDLLFSYRSNLDFFVVVLASGALVIFLCCGRRRFIHRWHGGVMLIGYSSYLVYLSQIG